MTSKNAIMIQQITQQIIESIWQRDSSVLLEYIDENVSLIEPVGNLLVQGRDEFQSILPRMMESIQKSSIRRRNFIIAQNCGNACTIIGHYDIDDGNSIRAQSCVFVWEAIKESQMVLKHIGISRPDDNATPGPVMPKIRILDKRSPRIVITDQSECTRFIYPQDILYATSDGRNTVVRCSGETINARISISEFIKKAGSSFVPVHRCYVVNTEHITLIKPYCVVLSDGSEIPVPVKRYGEIKNKITDMMI